MTKEVSRLLPLLDSLLDKMRHYINSNVHCVRTRDNLWYVMYVLMSRVQIALLVEIWMAIASVWKQESPIRDRQVLGWVVTLLPVLPIVTLAAVAFARQRFRSLMIERNVSLGL